MELSLASSHVKMFLFSSSGNWIPRKSIGVTPAQALDSWLVTGQWGLLGRATCSPCFVLLFSLCICYRTPGPASCEANVSDKDIHFQSYLNCFLYETIQVYLIFSLILRCHWNQCHDPSLYCFWVATRRRMPLGSQITNVCYCSHSKHMYQHSEVTVSKQKFLW